MESKRRGRKPIYEWESIEVGGYFVMTNVKLSSARSMCSNAGKILDRRFQAAQIDGGMVKVTRKA